MVGCRPIANNKKIRKRNSLSEKEIGHRAITKTSLKRLVNSQKSEQIKNQTLFGNTLCPVVPLAENLPPCCENFVIHVS